MNTAITHVEPPNLGPIMDSSPYWCAYIPRDAFRKVTGIAGDLAEHPDPQDAHHGLCNTSDQERYGPLSIGWSDQNAVALIAARMKSLSRKSKLTRLPQGLGFGFAVYAPSDLEPRPYVAVTAFSCGARKLWMSLDIRRVSAGRTPIADLTNLMQIAETRFGKLHDCTPGSV